MDDCLPVLEKEIVGVKEALSWVKQLRFQNVRVETYTKYVTMSLSSKKHYRLVLSVGSVALF